MKLFRVIGDERVAHSLSPRMHNAVLAKAGIAGSYQAWPVQPEALASAMDEFRVLGLAGANVTVPHKQAVAGMLDELHGYAVELGAVNTIVVQGDRLIGHNTDVPGFRAAVESQGVVIESLACVVVGAGGAARAVALSLREAGAKRVCVAGRSLGKVKRLADDLKVEACGLGDLADLTAACDLVVNATSVSCASESADMAAMVGALPLNQRARMVVDINYGRSDNLWEQWASSHSIRFMDGLAMLAHQARESFGLWTGIKPPVQDFLAPLETAQ